MLPTIICVHGSYHTVEFYDRVIAHLEPAGYKCITIPMPSTSGVALPDLTEDIAAIRSVVEKEVNNGNEVVIAAHSWGGMPTTNSVDGLGLVDRLKEGKTGGVKKLAFVATFWIPKGSSLWEVTGAQPEWFDVKDGFTEADNPVINFYHDLDSDDAAFWVSKLKRQSFQSGIMAKATADAHLSIPSAYLICEDDRSIVPSLQEKMIADARASGADIEKERLFVSHSPHLREPKFVSKFIRRAAGEQV